MTEEQSGIIRFSKMVGIVCGAVIAAATVIQFIGGYLWGNATRPIVDQIREERVARQFADSLIVGQIAGLAKAMVFQPGSAERSLAIRNVVDVPDQLEENKEHERNK